MASPLDHLGRAFAGALSAVAAAGDEARRRAEGARNAVVSAVAAAAAQHHQQQQRSNAMQDRQRRRPFAGVAVRWLERFFNKSIATSIEEALLVSQIVKRAMTEGVARMKSFDDWKFWGVAAELFFDSIGPDVDVSTSTSFLTVFLLPFPTSNTDHLNSP